VDTRGDRDRRDASERTRIRAALQAFGSILAVKLYRLNEDGGPDIPTLPCLDHEAMLHGGIQAHAAVYLQEAASGDLHEVAVYPGSRRIEIDIVSTWGEYSAESLARLQAHMRRTLPDYRLSVHGPSWWRGERRVAQACLAQVSLREVLLSSDFAAVGRRVNRLQVVGSMMEKHSRVASWGVRTVTGPLLTAAGVATFLAVGSWGEALGEDAVIAIRYGVVGILGAFFLYYGLKAVQLTEMANRVWKRSMEYALILSERQRLQTRG